MHPRFKTGDLVAANKLIDFHYEGGNLMSVPHGTFGVVKLAENRTKLSVKFVGFRQCMVSEHDIDQANVLDKVAWSVSDIDEQQIGKQGET
jgi:hypothetical protein